MKTNKRIIIALLSVLLIVVMMVIAFVNLTGLQSLFAIDSKEMSITGTLEKRQSWDLDNESDDCLEVRVESLRSGMDVIVEVRWIEMDSVLYQNHYTSSHERMYSGKYYITPPMKNIEVSVLSLLPNSEINIKTLQFDFCE